MYKATRRSVKSQVSEHANSIIQSGVKITTPPERTKKIIWANWLNQQTILIRGTWILLHQKKPLMLIFCADMSKVFIRKYLQNHLAHIYCSIEINGIYRTENVNLVSNWFCKYFLIKTDLRIFHFSKTTNIELSYNKNVVFSNW